MTLPPSTSSPGTQARIGGIRYLIIMVCGVVAEGTLALSLSFKRVNEANWIAAAGLNSQLR